MRLAVAALSVASCGGATATDPAAPADTTPAPPSTVWQTTNLPPPLTATVTARPARGPAIQLTEPPAAPTTTIAPPPHYDIWLRLAECESGSNWQINTGNGYYGGLQFNLQTWRVADGTKHATYPHHATPLAQMWTAEQVLTLRAGWGMNPWAAWPACARKLGLR